MTCTPLNTNLYSRGLVWVNQAQEWQANCIRRISSWSRQHYVTEYRVCHFVMTSGKTPDWSFSQDCCHVCQSGWPSLETSGGWHATVSKYFGLVIPIVHECTWALTILAGVKITKTDPPDMLNCLIILQPDHLSKIWIKQTYRGICF